MSFGDRVTAKGLLAASSLGACQPVDARWRRCGLRGTEASRRKLDLEGPKRDADQYLRKFSWEGNDDG